MERIGIYGGTFNPPHIGHLKAAEYALETLCLDELLVIPTKGKHGQPLPEGSASAQQRLEMLQLALQDKPGLRLSDMELTRDDPGYFYLTVEQVRSEHPNAQITLLMGSDMFLTLHNWKESAVILQNTDLAVLCRGDKGEKLSVKAQKATLQAQGTRVTLLDNPVVDISSTQLRRMLVFGCAAPFLPEGLGTYIWKKGLYGVNTDYRQLPMEKLEKVVVGLLNPNRVAHVLGCRDTAVELAKRWGADETDAARAGILHDITKALDGPLQLTLCAEYGTILSDFSRRYPKTLHALTGSLVADRIFGENEAVVSAICSHTTGKADMNLLEKIIYVADYMEPNRTLPGVDKLRQLAFSNIDGALKLGLEMTLEHLDRQGAEVSPESREALAWLNR